LTAILLFLALIPGIPTSALSTAIAPLRVIRPRMQRHEAGGGDGGGGGSNGGNPRGARSHEGPPPIPPHTHNEKHAGCDASAPSDRETQLLVWAWEHGVSRDMPVRPDYFCESGVCVCVRTCVYVVCMCIYVCVCVF
jgi:hypothetical protein